MSARLDECVLVLRVAEDRLHGLFALVATFTYVQSASTSYLRIATPSPVRSFASGIYVTWYYVGGSAGGFLPGILWERTGWIGCVGLVIAAQMTAAGMAYRGWRT